jgi:hypothetical protein
VINITIIYLMIPLAAGILSGYWLRQRKDINFNRVTFAVILVLIFSLGFTIGSNNDMLTSIPAVGASALGIAASAIIFSVLFVVLVRRKLKI